MDSEQPNYGRDTRSAKDLFNTFQTILMLICSTIGTLSAVIIAYTILRVRRMRTRTNLLLVHWAINDGFFTLSTIVLYLLLKTGNLHSLSKSNSFTFCVVTYMDGAFKFISTIFIGILISTTMMKSTNITDRAMLLIFYGVALLFSAIHTFFCGIIFKIPFIYLLVALTFVVMIPAMLIKDINQCYKGRKDPLSKETIFRLNIGRIYIYNWSFGALFLGLGYFIPVASPTFLELFFFSAYLSSLYILLYLVIWDRRFRMSLLSGLRLAADTYDVDAAIRFEENEGDNAEGSVNIDLENNRNNDSNSTPQP